MKQKIGWREAGESEDEWHLSFALVFDYWPVLTMISEQYNQRDATAPSANPAHVSWLTSAVVWTDLTVQREKWREV